MALGATAVIDSVVGGALDHRRFWDAMDAVTVEQLEEIESALTKRMIDVFGLDTQALILDMTNFTTFIDSGNALELAHRRRWWAF